MRAATARARASILVCAAAMVPGIVSGAGTDLDIKPGPLTISAEEAAIHVDLAKGIEHGVILVDETVVNDAYGNATRRKVHRRAKILSNTGRDLANIEISLAPDTTLEDWWARTLLPDGRVVELADKDVVVQSLLRAGSVKYRVARFAFPAVVPGSVIDYGYVTTRAALIRWTQVPLARDWPILKFRYRWKTYARLASAYRVRHVDSLGVNVQADESSVLITAQDIPPWPVERFMPPDDDVRPQVILYYMDRTASYKDFWNDYAKEIDKLSRAPANDAVVQQVLAIARAASTDTRERLKVAYDWIAANLPNPFFVRPDDGARPHVSASAGPSSALDKVYFDVARALGAECRVVLAPNRDDHTWDPEVRTIDQLPEAMLAVRIPGSTEVQTIFVQLRSGLPFGEVPWWNTGVDAMLASPDGSRPIVVPPSGPASNLSRVTAELSHSADGATLVTTWRRTSSGQNALSETQPAGLPRERNDRALTMCGRGPGVDVNRADSSTGYPPVATRLECEIEEAVVPVEPAISRYSVKWTGPWLGPLPELPSGPRTHPVAFDFPRVDLLELSLKSPHGFRPRPAPDATTLTGPFGKYRLVVTVTEDGYKVERAVALFAVAVPASEYDALRAFLDGVRRADGTLLEFERVRADP